MSRAMHSVATVHYPDSDGQPMAETHFQRRAMFYLLTALPLHFRDREDVYVSGDMFLYYEEGNPAAVVAPDVFVAIGAPKRADAPRRTYKLWEEPTGPDFVLEVVSDSTWQVDRDEKPELYAALGVREYWLFDPTGKHLRPLLRGMVLEGGQYRELAPKAEVSGGRAVHSEVLGLDLRVTRNGTIRLRDPVSGEDIIAHDETHDALHETRTALLAQTEARKKEAGAREKEIKAREKEAEAREKEAEARRAAEARIAELEALVRTLRGAHTSEAEDAPPTNER